MSDPNVPAEVPLGRIPTKERMLIARQDMPERDAEPRSRSFAEVNLGFDAAAALRESQRCLLCRKAHCVHGCPVGVDIPGFVGLVADGDLRGAAELLQACNTLPGITGRVCPQETQCEGQCPRGENLRGVDGKPVGIGYLERYVADWAAEHLTEPPRPVPPTGRKVAVVGSGPAGLTAAGELARRGHAVTVFEAFHEPGGVLVYGIPEFRLPKEIVRREIERLVAQGVRIECNAVIGRTFTLPELRKDYDAVFVAVGAGLPVFMDVPGEHLKGVYSANEYLTRVNLMGAWRDGGETPVLHGRRVAVVGGGNVAMDAVRTARRLGAEEAVIVYRRSHTELPARAEEVHHAEQEGVRFEFLTAPVRVIGDDGNWVTGLECRRMELGEPDQSGRRRPVPVAGSEYVLPCDTVIVAIGTRANPLLTSTAPDLQLNRWGYIETDESGQTSMPGVFAGGDIVRGAATVILAMGDGKRISTSIDAYLAAVTV
ncbi:MAG TPA: NADPH-dependent glutamate synthase [Kineosporiaceae bacterium]|nr:NADPH-dependent glutamate synthase [Kineosporiaceae bacterium]